MEADLETNVVVVGAAHIASPIGGQGNGPAIADAVVAHSTSPTRSRSTRATGRYPWGRSRTTRRVGSPPPSG